MPSPTPLLPLAGMLCLAMEQCAGQKPRNVKESGTLKPSWPEAKRAQAAHKDVARSGGKDPLGQENTWEQPPLLIFKGSWGPGRVVKGDVLALGGC